ncbi:MAG: transposase [Proteobacteria bacterium]|nr:transposase [Pseudomonadota bacterium]
MAKTISNFGISEAPLLAEIWAEISQAADANAHAVVLLDQAGWRPSAKVQVPDNITLMPLPPRSPERNPVENIWQLMRGNWLSDTRVQFPVSTFPMFTSPVFKSYENIATHCCQA